MSSPFSLHTYAAALGFDACGIAACRPLAEERSHLEAWLAQGFDGGLGYLRRDPGKRCDPALLQEGTRSVIVCAIAYKRPPTDHPLQKRIASYARGRDYHLVLREKLHRLSAALREAYPDASGRVFVDTAPLLEKAWAVRAGLGWIGHNTLLTHPRLGSQLLLGGILTDAVLEPDAPFDGGECGTCRACLDACPAGALREEQVLDAGRCIARRTVEAFVPEEEGELHGWIFGCDACLDACPYNRLAPVAAHPEIAPLSALSALDLEGWLALDEEAFRKRFSESPLGRCGLERLRRRIAALE